MIRESKLPDSLKNEMLFDLKNTLILYSNETLTYGQTQRSLIEHCEVAEKITKTSARGSSTEIVERCSKKSVSNRLGIEINPVNFQAKDLESTPVVAYTQANPNRSPTSLPS